MKRITSRAARAACGRAVRLLTLSSTSSTLVLALLAAAATLLAALPSPGADTRFFRLPQHRRGDVNLDDDYDISDPIALLRALFLGDAEIPCENSADTNTDRALDVSDAVYALNNLFNGGPRPEAPGPFECGVDRSAEALPCASYSLCPDDLPLITHVLNRVTFGPTEALLTEIQTRADLVAYIDEQLAAPEAYDQAVHEPELHAEIEALGIGFGHPGNAAQHLGLLPGSLIVNALKSRWQLLHVLAQFWNNHFHTRIDSLQENFFSQDGRGGPALTSTEPLFLAVDADTSGFLSEAEWSAFRALHPGAIPWTGFNRRSLVDDGMISLTEFLAQLQIAFWKYGRGVDQVAVSADMEKREYELYRRLAFGSFRDMLEACAKSVAMIIYLNTYENTVLAPNENYAREFFELQALGVDHVYTQRDIEALAKVFTGWTADWVARAQYDPADINFQGRPGARRFPINNREDPPFRFPTMENWDDSLYTWAFVFGNSRGQGHDWGRKDLFLERFGGVDSLGNPVSPLDQVTIPENTGNQTIATALSEFDLVLERVVSFRDCAKFISTKLIQFLVTEDLARLAKTYPMPADLQVLFAAADADQSGAIELSEWEEPIPLVLPNGRPPAIFAALDADRTGSITPLEYQEPDLLLDSIDAWRTTDGDIRAVLAVILHSEEFLSLKFYRAKVKTPFEVATSAARALDGTMNETLLLRTVEDLSLAGMELFHFSDPTGESELGFDWMHTVGLLERLKYLNRGAQPLNADQARFYWSPGAKIARWGLTTAESIVDYYTLLLYNGDILPNQTELALAELAASRTVTAAVAFLLSLPQFQKQ
jgi:uncharacterized protein (DUF1800 family)